MIKQLTLTRFRNHPDRRFTFEGGASKYVSVSGPNGSGKTNLLEAISYLSPGRGLRGASHDQIPTAHASESGWSVTAKIAEPDNKNDTMTISTDLRGTGGGREARLNGDPLETLGDLDHYLSVVWLTPQMDGLFLAAQSERRHFFDRLTAVFDPAHRSRLSRYETALRERNRLLKRGSTDSTWYLSLEQTLVETGIALVTSRQALIDAINRTMAGVESAFLQPRLAAVGDLETRLREEPAARVEQFYHEALIENRDSDRQRGYTTYGAHKSDFQAYHPVTGLSGDQCSTGEQKAFLINIVLSHARLLDRQKSVPLIVLLDDLLSHLDRDRRCALINDLDQLFAQCWISGTEPLDDILAERQAAFIHLEPDFSPDNK